MGHGWRVSLGLCVLVLSACGQGNSSTWKSFPVPIYADSTLLSRPGGSDDLQAAMSFWEQKAGKKLFDFKGQWSGGNPYVGDAAAPTGAVANVIFFQNPWPFAMEIAGRTTVFPSNDGIAGSVVMINPEIPLCAGDCAYQQNVTSQRKDFTHELGHFIGLNHSPDINNIMYPVLQPGGSLDSVSIDAAALTAAVNNGG